MRALLSLALCVGIVAAGMVAAVFVWKAGVAANAAGADTPKAPAALVQVEILQPRTVEDILWLTGRLEPWEVRTISAETTGPIHWQNMEEGQPVRQGQELVRIDTTPIQATHAQARARSTLASQELKRLENLRAAGITSPQDVDRASTEGKLAAADLAAANTKLDRSVLHAPIDGIVDTVYVKEKEFVDIGTALFKVVQTDRVKALIAVPERDIARFKDGDAVEIIVDALDGAEFKGTIHRIATSAERATRTFVTEVAVDNAGGRLKPGMTVRAKLVRNHFEQAIAVPLFTVISLENQHFVMLEIGGVAEVRPIVAGRVQGDRVHVIEGLAPGDRLIVQGHRDLRAGQPVRVQDAQAG